MTRKVFLLAFSLLALLPLAHALEVGEEAEDVGSYLELDGGIRIQVVIEEQKIVAHFIDADNLVIEPTASEMVFQVTHSGRRTDNWRTVLSAGPGASMTSGRSLPPPYNLKFRVIIRFTDGSTKTFARKFLNLARNLE